VIFLERLQIANMVRNHHLAQLITDAGWNTFKQMCDYKSKLMVEVDPRNTTIDCSRCGNKVPKSLSIRIHRCDKCGLVIDRDYNSAIEINNRGLWLLGVTNTLPMGHREVTPVEIPVESRKQEEAPCVSVG
jgi:putative transposase